MFDFTLNSIFIENILFVVFTTAFLAITGWAWQDTQPYQLPNPLPNWFGLWFGSVQILGGLLPLVALIWVIWQGNTNAIAIFASYIIVLGLQILSEFLTLRKFQSVVWVMVPYLYVPYRIWQLYEGLVVLTPIDNWFWIRMVLWVNLVVWIGNYLLDLAQLPRLFRWELQEEKSSKSIG
ncbi:hypothetical protein [Geitlerinema sp. PCC 9228]|uniref:DUF7733 domain-containing protein n=1 Tax=Geitlerinema sp. PCC 9228 TaxID=111611 RepID=UPI0008F98AD6|nr:hypothetical protein [Geitlerinema sp. PCC 9228]